MDGKMVFGLDLGINNVGWCALLRAESDVDILSQGTLVFESPLQDEAKPQDGLKTKERGIKRRSRDTMRRRRQRKRALHRLLAEHGFLPKQYAARTEFFCRTKDPETGEPIHPYALRAKALKEPLTPHELGRVLCHLNQRRGFLSPRDLMALNAFRVEETEADHENLSPEEREELKGIKGEIELTRSFLDEFPTVGAFMAHRIATGEPVRKTTLAAAKRRALEGKSKDEKKQIEKDFTAREKIHAKQRFVRPDRHMIQDEFDAILGSQRRHHPLLTDSLVNQIRKLIFDQRLLAANLSSRGKCTFLPDEYRAPRASLTSQKFVIAQELAHLTVSVPGGTDDFGGMFGGEISRSRSLTAEEIQLLLGHLMKGDSLTWLQAKTMLNLPKESLFNREPGKITVYENGKLKQKKQTTGTKEKLRGSQTVDALRRILPDKWDLLDAQSQENLVGEIVSIRDWVGDTHEKPAAVRRRDLFLRKAYGPNQVTFTEKEANLLATVSLPDGYLNLSNRAIKRIMPYLITEKAGRRITDDGEIKESKGPMVYSAACEFAGFNHAQPDGPRPLLERLPYPKDSDIPNALVRTSVRSAVRILNALRKKYGQPDAIHLELPRDLAMGAKQRAEEEAKLKERETQRTRIRKILIHEGIFPSKGNIRKFQLWEELDGKALPYEPDRTIATIKELFSGDYEVEHIVPRGHSLDNSFGNLTLASRATNSQLKGNRTPWEAFGQHDPEGWRRIEAHVRSLKSMHPRKRDRILAKTRPEDFTGRHLATIGYISKEVLRLAQQMVPHDHQALVVSGRATSELRKEWGLNNLVELHPVEAEEQAKYKEWEEAFDEDPQKAGEPPKAGGPGKARSNYKHHALDALVVALTDRASLQAMAQYMQWRDEGSAETLDKDARKRRKALALPDPNLREKAEAALQRAVVVHRPNRRPGGQLHKENPQTDGLEGLAHGEPWGSKVVGNVFVRYDHTGKPAQAYPLGSNHHVLLMRSLQPNRKGETEYWAEVIPTIEAWRRKSKGEPIIQRTPKEGYEVIMALCAGDMVEMEDGTIARLSKMSKEPTEGTANLVFWYPHVASQLGKINPQNPYLVASIRSTKALATIKARIIMNPLGEIVYREGG